MDCWQSAGLGLLVGCQAQPPPEMTDTGIVQDEAAARQELSSLVDSYKEALLRRDAEAVMSMYAPDVRVFWTGMNFSRDDLRAFLEESFQTTTWTKSDYE